MLFKILRLFGLDIPARIEAAKASLELRLARLTDQVGRVAQEAAVIGALAALATLTAAMAAGVGLIALYRATADAYGAYAGLGVVGVILVAATVTLATVAAIRAKSMARDRFAGAPSRHGATPDPYLAVKASATADAQPDGYFSAYAAGSAPPIGSASDLVEPLGYVLSRLKYPSLGHSAVDAAIGHLRATARGTAEEAIERAAAVVRHGDRTNLIVVLTGAAFVGWLLSHPRHWSS